MAPRTRASLQRGLPVIDRRGHRVGSVRKVGAAHLEVYRALHDTVLVPFAAVFRLDAEGVHVDALAGDLPSVPPEDLPATGK